jgi:hypothetical protein
MTQQQREAVAGMLRASPFDPASDLREQRPLFGKMIAAAPVPAEVVTTPGHHSSEPLPKAGTHHEQQDEVSIPPGVRGAGRDDLDGSCMRGWRGESPGRRAQHTACAL